MGEGGRVSWEDKGPLMMAPDLVAIDHLFCAGSRKVLLFQCPFLAYTDIGLGRSNSMFLSSPKSQFEKYQSLS